MENRVSQISTKQVTILLIILCLGFFIVYAGHIDRNLPQILNTSKGPIDLSFYSTEKNPNMLYGICFITIFLLTHFYIKIKLPQADPFIFPAVAILSGIGLIMMLRLSPDLAIVRNDAIQAVLSRDPNATVRQNVQSLSQLGMKQFLMAGLGCLTLIATVNLLGRKSFSWLASKKYLWVLLSVLLILVTVFFGTKVNGKRLWLLGIQPIEIVKIMLLLFISAYVYQKGKGIVMYQAGGLRQWAQYAGPFMVMWLFALAPIVLQGDLGPTFLIFIVFLILFHYVGTRKSVTMISIFLIALAGLISYKIGWPSIVKTRMDMFLDPFGASESISRALWAVSSGGLFGSGIGYGHAYRIPEVQSDFNFACICEEMGLLGGVVVILAYVIIIGRCLVIASHTDNIHKKTLVVGIGLMIGLQAAIIIAGNLSAIPLTGITLPIISYGGSSMIATFSMIGIALRISGEER